MKGDKIGVCFLDSVMCEFKITPSSVKNKTKIVQRFNVQVKRKTNVK